MWGVAVGVAVGVGAGVGVGDDFGVGAGVGAELPHAASSGTMISSVTISNHSTDLFFTLLISPLLMAF